ncbi:hypothetical protein VR41_02500 [Streptomyces sp. NRRL B-1568]|nr:hypothetical protein VR41_02500 [Streptomyces sp. NRRL B-1568]
MTRTGARAHAVRRLLIALAPHALACAVFLAVFMARRDQLPDPLATHFSGAGHADGFTTAGAFLYQGLALMAVPGVLLAALAYALDARPGRAATAVGYGVAGFLGSMLTSVVLDNAHAGSAERAHLALWEPAAALAVGAAAGAVGWLLAGRGLPPRDEAPVPLGPAAPSLTLGKGESAAWTRSVASRPLRIAGLALLAAGGALVPLAGWGAGVSLFAGGPLVLLLSGARVTVDRHGLTANVPGLPRPRLRIPLARIETATSRHIDPLRDLGGWGYRAVPGRSGLAFRSGEALVARLTTGSEFVITVDDAATAAALLNALADRDHAETGA